MAINFPSSPTNGQTYTNSTTGITYTYTTADSAWIVSGGSILNRNFYENDKTITADYTVNSGKNAMTAGPITINSGVTVTVPSGSVWTIV